jgi:hypothetical protein
MSAKRSGRRTTVAVGGPASSSILERAPIHKRDWWSRNTFYREVSFRVMLTCKPYG